ncbi:MAG: NPCBM/NEW2 domain-containing protein, partial [Planctomycetaceae bacterium]
MNLLVLLCCLLPAFPGEVRLSLADGTVRSGDLKLFDGQRLVLQSDGQQVEVPAAEVLQLEFRQASSEESSNDSAAVPVQRVYLRDGSELSGEGLQRAAAEVLLRSVVWGDLRIPVNSVSAVRLQAEMPAFAEQWGTFQQRKSEKDLLIVVKRDGSGLDFLSGIVSAIGSEAVEFLLDGEKVPVPAARVYGVVFGRSENTGAVPAGGVRVLLANGDVLRGRELRLADDRLQLQGSWGQSLQCEAGKLRLADLSGERLSYLSELPVLREALLSADPEGSLLDGLVDTETQRRLFSPRRDRVLQGGGRLRLRGQEYLRGLCVHSHSVLSWALDGRYETLELTAGVDDEVAFNAGAGHAVR